MAVKKQARLRARVPRAHKNESAMLKTSKSKVQLDGMKVKNKKTLVIAQEIKIARLLANNDKRIRDKVLKRLKKWLTMRSQSSFEFTNTDFMSLWKGLFYCMWMSDKMLIQEELAESISKLVHCFKSRATIVLYTSCALTTLATEWFGIDQYRLDKFSMLVRRVLRQTFIVCRDRSWDLEWVTEISDIFEKLFLDPKTGLGFNLHVTEIYLEELAKVSDGDLSEDAVHEFIKPFILYLATSSDERQMKHIMRHIFRYLIFQSNVGMDYTEKFEAWRNAGFPCVSVDDMEKVEISEDENSDDDNEELPEETKERDLQSKPLDPRAGRVDVELPQLSFDAAEIAARLEQYKFHPSSTAKSRRQLLRLIVEFRELAEEKMPLGVKKVRKPSARKNSDMNSKKGALRLIQFQKDLFFDKLSKKQKRKKYRELITSDDTDAFDALDNSETENISDLDMDEDAEVDSENDSTDVSTIAKTNSTQNSSVNVPTSKKREKTESISTQNKSAIKRKIIEYFEKKSEMSMTLDKILSIKLKQLEDADAHATDTNVKRKMRAAPREQVFDDEDQASLSCRFSSVIASVSQDQGIRPKKRSKKKRAIEKPVPKTSALQTDNQATPLKTELSNQVKQIDRSTSAKKKVVFGLYRNTAQHTSEYLLQVRKSPAIPFDANRKPLQSVLKPSPLSCPLNPFYKRKFAMRNLTSSSFPGRIV